jgi:predicted AAA+ superfamily ATPase
MKDYPRWQVNAVEEALKVRRVVVISGSRQTGKTTLTKQVLDENKNPFKSLDLKAYLDAAKNDPTSFVRNTSGTMVIDEIQKAPELISEIKYVVDRDNRPGQYLLTGSANIQSLPSVSESLAGRVRNIRLRPLTQGEILRRKPTFLDRAFFGDFPMRINGCDKNTLLDIAFRGGFPEAVRLKTQKERKAWGKDYIAALVEKDMRDIANITRQGALKDLIGILAAWSGRFMDVSSISSQTGVSRPTISSYINSLEALYLFERVMPWIKTDYDRVGRIHKMYATDTGLLASVLDWKYDDVANDATISNADRAGKMMETFVFQELSAQVDLTDDYTLYQYRDREKREIDFIVERSDGALLGIAVKAGRSVSKDSFAPQSWFRENIVKGRKPYIGLILYSGENTLSFGNGMFALPTAALWEE